MIFLLFLGSLAVMKGILDRNPAAGPTPQPARALDPPDSASQTGPPQPTAGLPAMDLFRLNEQLRQHGPGPAPAPLSPEQHLPDMALYNQKHAGRE